jgi:hypothetical protein
MPYIFLFLRVERLEPHRQVVVSTYDRMQLVRFNLQCTTFWILGSLSMAGVLFQQLLFLGLNIIILPRGETIALIMPFVMLASLPARISMVEPGLAGREDRAQSSVGMDESLVVRTRVHNHPRAESIEGGHRTGRLACLLQYRAFWVE